MALTQRLEFRQSQSLVMTPQLMQAIKLLQLSNLDLSAFVEEELERNPLLERASDGTEPPVAGEPAPERAELSDRDDSGSAYGDDGPGERVEMASGAAGEGFEPAQEDWMNNDLGSRAEIEQTLDTGLDNVFSEEPSEAAARTAQDAAPTAYTEWGGGASNDDSYNLEAFVAAEVTLGSHLAEQLAVAFTQPAQRMIGQYLIDLVDEAGYLPPDLGQAAERLGASQADVEAVLAVLQKFDPPGVCARNLSECLAIQLRELNRYDPAMQALVEHLDLLAKRDIAALRKLCGVDDDDITDMIGEIRRLDPKPGLKFGSARTQTVVPDVYVRPRPRWRLACRTQQRHAAARAGQPDLLHRTVEDHPQGRRQVLFHRLPAERDLAGARARSARPHHPEGRDRDRAPAGRLLHPRRRASAAAQSQGGGGRDPDA